MDYCHSCLLTFFLWQGVSTVFLECTVMPLYKNKIGRPISTHLCPWRCYIRLSRVALRSRLVRVMSHLGQILPQKSDTRHISLTQVWPHRSDVTSGTNLASSGQRMSDLDQVWKHKVWRCQIWSSGTDPPSTSLKMSDPGHVWTHRVWWCQIWDRSGLTKSEDVKSGTSVHKKGLLMLDLG